MKRKRVAIMGSSGSIGRACLDVVAHLTGRFEVSALAARAAARTVCTQARRFQTRRVVLTDWHACQRVRAQLGPDFEVGWGVDSLIDVAASDETDILVMAMTGTAGLLPVIAALEAGKRVALATKEILVAYGDAVVRLASRTRGGILPIDSELSAIHQCIRKNDARHIRRVILTASGGPFWKRELPRAATVRQVLRHPTWNMGRKTTVDSATLMNKGLEVIETCRLLELAPDQVDAVIHPQSVIHSLVEFEDRAMLAQLSVPDMRLPIQYALTCSDRLPSLARPLNLTQVRSLEFYPVQRTRFPCFGLAYKALRHGPTATCVLNSANQVAVAAFLAGQIVFTAIPGIISRTLNRHITTQTRRLLHPGIRTLMRLETWAADYASALVRRLGARAGS